MCRLRHGAVEMHDANQRMARLEPEKPIILFNSVRLYYIRSMIHNSNAFLSITYISLLQYKGNIFSPIMKVPYHKTRN